MRFPSLVFRLLLLCAAALQPAFSSAYAQPARPPVRVGVLFDGEADNSRQIIGSLSREAALDLLTRETLSLTQREFDVQFPASKRLSGGFTGDGIAAAFDRLIADPEVDIIVTLGAFGSHTAATRGPLPKPVVAPFVIDPAVQGIPIEGNASGVENLNYIMLSVNVREAIRTFHELVPWDTLHVVHDPLFTEIIPSTYGYVDSTVRALGATLVPVPVIDDPGVALAALDGAEAVLHAPLSRMPDAAYERLVAGYAARGLPSFSVIGLPDVERGTLAGFTAEVGVDRLMRRVALNLQRIMLGEDAGMLPVRLDGPRRLAINMETARRIEWAPRWAVATGAELLNEAPADSGVRITLGEAVIEATRANLDLRAADRSVLAGTEEANRARAALLPQADATGLGVQIDETRAGLGLGTAAEKTISGSIGFTQLIFSDAAWGNYTIQKRLQDSRVADRARLRFDVALEAATAFLDVLRARTLERIQKQNLRLTQSNLELARRRQQLGVSGPADVYRWESRLAADRRDVIGAQRTHEAVQAAFNRVLNRPQNQPFDPVEPNLADTTLRTGRGRLLPYVDNARVFETFSEFAVKEGLRNAFELQALDAAIAAQERLVSLSSRRFWLPDVAFFGDIGKDFRRSGIGSSAPILPPPYPSLPSEPQTEWSLGVRASIPLLEGGSRVADLSQARKELEQLRLERNAAAERIELRIRTALQTVATSSSAIDLNRQSAEAAAKNLELVTDSYSQGVLSIIELLDAQNNALIAELQAANSVYDFLVDLFALQRAISNMDFLTSEAEREAWFGRLQEYFRVAGVEPLRIGR